MRSTTRTTLGLILLVLCLSQTAHGAVIGLDFGSEWFKFSVVKPGVPMEIGTNEASKRKTANAIAFSGDERLFGDPASSLRARYPDRVYNNLLTLIGKPFEHPSVQEAIKSPFFPSPLTRDSDRGGVLVQCGAGTCSVEEVTGMILRYVRDLAASFAKALLKDIVITVPAYFTQYEREAIMDAAAIADLRVLSLINTGSAVALHYGIDRDFTNETNILFFDMGARGTEVTLVTYSSTTVKDGSKNKTVGQMEVKAVSWNAELGGQSLDMVLAQHLADVFNEQHKAKKMDVRTSPRSMAKLLIEAERVKRILSANSEAVASVESLYDEMDFRTSITRADFEKLAGATLEKLTGPITQVLHDSGFKLADIHGVEVFGGSTRIPKVQQILRQFFQKDDITAHLNTDEAAALGAGFFAASLSSAFRVRKFGITDISPFPVGVRTVKDEGDKPSKRTVIFSHNSRLGARKMKEYKKKEDFAIELWYESHQQLPFDSAPFLKVDVVGVADKLAKYNASSKHPVKIQVQFSLTKSGVAVVDKAEASVVEEVTYVVTPTPVPAANATANATKGAANDTAAAKDPEVKETERAEAGEAAEKDQDAAEQVSSDEGDADDKDAAVNEAPADHKKDATAPAGTTKTYSKYHKLVFETVASALGKPAPMTAAQIKAASKRLVELAEKDRQRRERDDARNALEAYIYEAKDKLSSIAEGAEVALPEQVEAALAVLNAEEEWLYEEVSEVAASEFKQRLEKVRADPDAIFERATELDARPKAFSECLAAIEFSRTKLANISETMPWVKNETLADLEKDINGTDAWLQEHMQKQASLAKHQPPAVRSADVEARTKILIKRLAHVSSIPKPKPSATPKKDSKKEKEAKSKGTAEAEPEPEQAGEGGAGKGKESAGEAPLDPELEQVLEYHSAEEVLEKAEEDLKAGKAAKDDAPAKDAGKHKDEKDEL